MLHGNEGPKLVKFCPDLETLGEVGVENTQRSAKFVFGLLLWNMINILQPGMLV